MFLEIAPMISMSSSVYSSRVSFSDRNIKPISSPRAIIGTEMCARKRVSISPLR